MAGDNEVDAPLRNIRHDPRLVERFRELAVAKLHNHAGELLKEEEAALVPVLRNDRFKAKWGAYLERTSNEKIVRLALETLREVVHNARPGRTGVREIDDDRGFSSMEDFEKFVVRPGAPDKG